MAGVAVRPGKAARMLMLRGTEQGPEPPAVAAPCCAVCSRIPARPILRAPQSVQLAHPRLCPLPLRSKRARSGWCAVRFAAPRRGCLASWGSAPAPGSASCRVTASPWRRATSHRHPRAPCSICGSGGGQRRREAPRRKVSHRPRGATLLVAGGDDTTLESQGRR